LGLVKITKSERIQDGVVRLEFVAAKSALNYLQELENSLNTIAQSLGTSKEKVVESILKRNEVTELSKKKIKAILRKVAPLIAKSVSLESKITPVGNVKIYSIYDDQLDDEYHISIGEKAVELDKSLIYIAVFTKGEGISAIVFAGDNASKLIKAGTVAKEISLRLGGSGGGSERFGQGGGSIKYKEKINDVLLSVEDLIARHSKE
jgi:alanyl-tRNA synthetase